MTVLVKAIKISNKAKNRLDNCTRIRLDKNIEIFSKAELN